MFCCFALNCLQSLLTKNGVPKRARHVAIDASLSKQYIFTENQYLQMKIFFDYLHTYMVITIYLKSE